MTTGIGLADWYDIKKAGAVSALGDLGELAARLGSINTFDRRGDTVWMDDFEASCLKWLSLTSGVGASVALSTERARNGSQSCKMTAGSTSSRNALLYRSLAYPMLSKIGHEFSFSLNDAVDYIHVIYYLYNGTNMLLPQIRYDKASQLLQYANSVGSLITLASGLNNDEGTILFWTWKLVVDYINQKYVRLILNERAFDLADIAIQVGTSTAMPMLHPVIEVRGLEESNGIVHIDDVIITQNES